MYQDYEMLFSSEQELDKSTGTYVSTNVVDIGSGNTAKNIGSGEQITIVVTVTEAFTSAGSTATLTIQPFINDTENNTGAEVLVSSPALAIADLGLGAEYSFTLPALSTQYKAGMRYLGIDYIIGTQATATGKVDAVVTVNPQTNA
jgi:hypothetical protein